MSLLIEAMEPCHLMDKTTTTPDGMGGYISTYTPGGSFNAAIVFNTSLEARRAQAEGVKSLYTVTTSRSVVLEYHDVFVRESDGKVFRVTSDGDDKYTPKSAALDMRQVTAEEWNPISKQGVTNEQGSGNS